MRLMCAVPQVVTRPAANPALYVGLRWLPGLCATTMQWIIIWKFSGLQLQPIRSAWSPPSRVAAGYLCRFTPHWVAQVVGSTAFAWAHPAGAHHTI